MAPFEMTEPDAGWGGNGVTLPGRAPYGSLDSFLHKYDLHARRDRFLGTTEAAFHQWQETARQTLSCLLGLRLMEEAPLLPQKTEALSLPGDILRERWILQVEPGVYMPLYLLIPKEPSHPSPFLCPPGHGGGGKASIVGQGDYPGVQDVILRYHYDYGLFLARSGYVALCPDARGFGERREDAGQAGSLPGALLSDCRRLSHMGNPLGIPVIGMFTWDLMRAIDFLVWLGRWDLGQLGCLGFSGGGMQTLFLASLDERVRVAVISGYLYGYRDSLLRQNQNCCCNYVPGLWRHFDMGDIASLIAPRPLYIQSCRSDGQNGPRGIDNCMGQVEIIREAYALLKAADSLLHEVCPGGHQFHEECLLENLEKLRKGGKNID